MRLLDDFRQRAQVAWRRAMPPVEGAGLWDRLRGLPRAVHIAAGALLFLILYYGVVGPMLSRVDADLGLRPDAASLPPGGSVAVGMAARLMDREIEDHGWRPNDPFFMPTALLDDMPAFQRGQQAMVLPFVLALRDGLGGADEDIARAADAFSHPPDRWWLRSDWPFLGMAAESEYRNGIAALRRYNERVARGQVSLGQRADLLIALLDQIALRLGSAAAVTERQVEEGAERMIDGKADVQFHDVRGQAYAAALLMRGLQEDFGPLIRERELLTLWGETRETLDALVAYDPAIILNGAPGGLLFKNHLTEQGYYLLLARGKLREITAVLQR